METNRTHVKKLYDQEFSALDYIATYYGQEFHIHELLLNYLYNLLLTGKVKGKTFLDFGCGPTVHAMAAASKFFDTIVACDYTKDNREQLKLWIENQPGAHDWSSQLKFCAKLEGFDNPEEDWKEIAARTRSKVQTILRCDACEEYPLEKKMEPFDVVYTSYCLESASLTANDYITVVKNLGSLVKPKGTVVALGAIGSTWYTVGDKTFPSCNLNKELIEKAFSSAGFSLEHYEEAKYEDDVSNFTDSRKYFRSVFKKM